MVLVGFVLAVLWSIAVSRGDGDSVVGIRPGLEYVNGGVPDTHKDAGLETLIEQLEEWGGADVFDVGNPSN